MANRPVFLARISNGFFVEEIPIDFKWSAGFAASQKQKNIKALHEKFTDKYSDLKVLEISTKSINPTGVNLSAFNLMVKNKKEELLCSVEALFQSSKRFKLGGPYEDIRGMNSLEAKKDKRLKESGDLIEFIHNGESWGLEPKTQFYDWIYINTIHQHKALREEIIKYDAFTDIEFNPKKSINNQARAAALYVSLYREGVLEKVLRDKEYYKYIITYGYNNERAVQMSLI